MTLLKVIEEHYFHDEATLILFENNIVALGKWVGLDFVPNASSSDGTTPLLVQYPSKEEAAKKYYEYLLTLTEQFDMLKTNTVQIYKKREEVREQFRKSSNQQTISDQPDANEHGG